MTNGPIYSKSFMEANEKALEHLREIMSPGAYEIAVRMGEEWARQDREELITDEEEAVTEFDWHSMTDEEKQAFIRESIERHHEQRYLAALEFLDQTGPAWADLTEEQRERVREENRRYDREMQAFGESLRNL